MSGGRHALLWILFGLASVAVGLIFVWQATVLIRLEQAERVSRLQRLENEVTRTALWRLDSFLSPLITAEYAWPMYGMQVDEIWSDPSIIKDRLYLTAADSGAKQKPESITFAALNQHLPKTFSETDPSSVQQIAQISAQVQKGGAQPEFNQSQNFAQQLAVPADYQNRMTQNNANQMAFNKVINMGPVKGSSANLATTNSCKILWQGSDLVIAGRASGSDTAIRATVINWPVLKHMLESQIADLLPSGRLESSNSLDSVEHREQILASLPVRLLPGPLEKEAQREPTLLPFISLAGATILAALGGLGVMLWTVVSLGERRRKFVSAVTHELRTPLTTFQLYSEMLAEGMVPEDKRAQYLNTLQGESRRLKHLVENILSFARLERRAGGRSLERVSIGRLFEPWLPRFREHLAGANMVLVDGLPEEDIEMETEPDLIEQILFNLVDNAKKYACDAKDKQVHVTVRSFGERVQISVCDHGPGMPNRKVIRPFSVSSEEAAARKKPGIGLGLDLSRRLAKHLGGQLSLKDHKEFGACFILDLPKKRA